MPYVFYYLTEDPNNLKECNEVNYLRLIGRVVVVTRGGVASFRHGDGVKSLNLPNQSPLIARAYLLWTKICYLLARPSNSLTDRGFPLRNIYTGNSAVRCVINFLWPAKYFGVINRLLPTYETLYFAPFRLFRLFVQDKPRSSKHFRRIVVHDSLILRLTKFTPFILAARRGGLQTIANVKSWDNPFYSQFIREASGYLTWSQSMWRDVQRIHNIGTTVNHSWGPRPFYNFANAVRLSDRQPNVADGTIVIGYAAAYFDNLMASYEIKIVAGIADALKKSGIDAKILLRPYPTVSSSIYDSLLCYQNIEIVNIQGMSVDRYGDGREMIRFGSEEERIHYLSRCHCFLSIATSFTFEAALFDLPVLQYYVPKKRRNSEYESCFFERLDISDHILNYFVSYLKVAENTHELINLIKDFIAGSVKNFNSKDMMLLMGFPNEWSDWDNGSRKFVTELQLP